MLCLLGQQVLDFCTNERREITWLHPAPWCHIHSLCGWRVMRIGNATQQLVPCPIFCWMVRLPKLALPGCPSGERTMPCMHMPACMPARIACASSSGLGHMRGAQAAFEKRATFPIKLSNHWVYYTAHAMPPSAKRRKAALVWELEGRAGGARCGGAAADGAASTVPGAKFLYERTNQVNTTSTSHRQLPYA